MKDFYYNRDQYSMNVYYNNRFLLQKYSIFNECLLKWSIFTTKVINIQYIYLNSPFLLQKWNNDSINAY